MLFNVLMWALAIAFAVFGPSYMLVVLCFVVAYIGMRKD